MTFQNTVLGVAYLSIMAAGFLFLSSPSEYIKDSKAVNQIDARYMQLEAVALGLEQAQKVAS